MLAPKIPLIQTQLETAAPEPNSELIYTLPSPHTQPGTAETSPSMRHPLSRPLSPDLPTRDALYLFSNFSSYMRSPDEGARGIVNSDDFRDTIRLLDYARYLAAQPYANVHVLHLKYRFQGADQVENEDRPGQTYNSQSRFRKTAPQPFSTLHDAVIKIDYKENGCFEPLPAQAVFEHVAKACQPSPRMIVASYVQCRVTENHLASLSTWALSSSPPAYVFSPLETRLRETRPIKVALHHAIPMSMYAWPAAMPSPGSKSPSQAKRIKHERPSINTTLNRRRSADSKISSPSQSPGSPEHRSYPEDPVATLTVLTGDVEKDNVNPDRIPLWALTPGIGILHGSTAASLGIKLTDFSAKNLVDNQEAGMRNAGNQNVLPDLMNIQTSPFDPRDLRCIPPVEHVSRTGTATPEPISRPNSLPVSKPKQLFKTHLTPPDATPPSLGKRTQSWPAKPSKVPGWRRGRREVMEDALQELGLGEEDQTEDLLRSLSIGAEVPVSFEESGWDEQDGGPVLSDF